MAASWLPGPMFISGRQSLDSTVSGYCSSGTPDTVLCVGLPFTATLLPQRWCNHIKLSQVLLLTAMLGIWPDTQCCAWAAPHCSTPRLQGSGF